MENPFLASVFQNRNLIGFKSQFKPNLALQWPIFAIKHINCRKNSSYLFENLLIEFRNKYWYMLSFSSSKKWPKQIKNVHISENSVILEPASFLVGVLTASRNSENILPLIRKSYRKPIVWHKSWELANQKDRHLL